MEKFKVGIIGLRRQASQDHIPAVLSSDLTELKAVCAGLNTKFKLEVLKYKRETNSFI